MRLRQLAPLVPTLVLTACVSEPATEFVDDYTRIWCGYMECYGIDRANCEQDVSEGLGSQSECPFDEEAAQACIDALPGPECPDDTETVPEPPEACDEVFDCTGGDPSADPNCAPIGSVLDDLGVATVTDQGVVILSSGDLTTGSDGTSTTTSEGETDQLCVIHGRVDASNADTTAVDCTTDGVHCAPGGTRALSGEVAVIAVNHDGGLPASSNAYDYQYGFVFETDDDSTNDWVGSSSYPNDFFIGTDTWVELNHSSGTWATTVKDIGAGDTITPRSNSEARVVRDGSVVVMLMPLSELGTAPDFRVTAFRHDGSFLNGEWNADYHPAVGTLLPLE